jgi:preprotein translocase subunit SecD
MQPDIKNKLIMTGIFLLLLASVIVIWTKPIKLGLDLRGGMRLIMEAKDTDSVKADDRAVNGAVEVIRSRIDGLGVAEPVIQRKGAKQIVVELPGISDPERAINLIGETALLEFKTAEWLPGDISLLSEAERKELMGKDGKLDAVKVYDAKGTVIKETPIILHETVLTGSDLKSVDPSTDQYGRPIVSLEFNSDGARKFYAATLRSVGKPLAIILDGKIISAPNVNEAIAGGRAQISGSFTIKEMQDLVIKLQAGSLPVPVEIVANQVVGPTLGADAMAKSWHAAGIGFAVIAAFMLLFYTINGLVAMVALAMYVLFTIAVLILMGTTLTLPGIAGLILSVGMAVDANIIIFERFKEEMRWGKTLFNALDAAFNRAFTSILDGNLTTIMGVAFLFIFGTGSIKGFAVTLTAGIIVSMFTAVTVSQYFLRNVYHIKAVKEYLTKKYGKEQ